MSVRVWQLAAFAYVLVLMLVALEFPLALNLSKRVDAEVKAESANQAQLVAASAAGRLDRRAELRDLARTAAASVGGRVLLVDVRGRLLADSAPGARARAGYAGRPEIAEALRGGVAQGTRFSRTLDEELLFTAVPILDDGSRAGAVRITQAVDSVRTEVRRDTLALLGLGLVALVLGLGVAWLLAGFLTRPLRALTATTRRLTGGDLDARAEEAGAREHRELARAFNDMTDRLARSLVAQREFASNAAHQLRTPLTGLRLRLESAALQTDDPALRRDLEAGEREAERLARTVTGLLVLARDGQRPDPPEPPDVSRAAAGALERWRGVAEQRGRGLVLDDRGGGVRVAASSEDLAVILDNLIENALDHTADGTKVTISTMAGPGYAGVAVSDRGPGLAAGEEQTAFDRFYRGASSADRPHGSGLGLAIVQALAHRWDGEATLVNRPGGGVKAEVRLPAAEERS